MADLAFTGARDHLRALWEQHSTDAQRQVLTALGDGKAVERRYEHAAQELERQGILRKVGEEYAFGGKLVERYVAGEGRGGFFKRLFG